MPMTVLLIHLGESLLMKSEPKIEPVKSSKLVIRLGYSDVLVLDYKDGMKFIESLEKAEHLDESYSSSSKGSIQPFKKGNLTFETMSGKEYEDRKMAGLLGLTYEQFINPEKVEAA